MDMLDLISIKLKHSKLLRTIRWENGSNPKIQIMNDEELRKFKTKILTYINHITQYGF